MTLDKKKGISVDIVIILTIMLLLFFSFFIVDWVIYFKELENVYYAGIAKPTLTFLCFLLVIYIKPIALDKKDWFLLFFAFLCMVPTDILMSIYGLSPNIAADSPLFMIGGILSIVAHGIFAIRHGKGFPYWKKSHEFVTLEQKSSAKKFIDKFWIGLSIFGTGIIIVIILWTDIVRIGHTIIAPIYLAFFCMSTWISWEAVRYKLYPKKNGILLAIGMTAWFLTEVVGEIYNIGIGNPSEIAFRFVWVFYSTTIICLSLSGLDWTKKRQ
ncbi:hypothetical protein NEF87_000953 [Candidatus Lokiarchaeum ossiferum]|uniref:YhhN-like protein n=1 Tax=Candidatus Lokiarchaeum ossiferum TaxID=2951803 RepID=A0ABY6HME0_9ARCH|nr:hypothetical protein NEF87_000953 [Candidatus Lokiarchaeum sp. B-35]